MWKLWPKGPRQRRGWLSQRNQMTKLSRKPSSIFKILWYSKERREIIEIKHERIITFYARKIMDSYKKVNIYTTVTTLNQTIIGLCRETNLIRTKRFAKVLGAAKRLHSTKNQIDPQTKQKELSINNPTTPQIITTANPKASTQIFTPREISLRSSNCPPIIKTYSETNNKAKSILIILTKLNVSSQSNITDTQPTTEQKRLLIYNLSSSSSRETSKSKTESLKVLETNH